MRQGAIPSLAILIAIAVVPTWSCASSRTASMDARVDPLFATWNRPDSPGCSVGVSRNGAVIYERGYGMANLERKVPISSTTVFRLASITKAFTAMSVLLAAERGLLSLDDDVSKYIPEWSNREHRVTIRHLIAHTSGIRDAYLLQGWSPNSGTSTDALVRLMARQRDLNSVPGAEYNYNNGGYVLLGKILERASGQTLGAFADANIFKPLGMTGAWFNGDPVRTAPDHASAYSSQANGWRVLEEGAGYGGNAGMMSSVRDLLIWANNFSNPRVGTPALLASMQTASVLTGGQSTQHGLGFGLGNYRGARTVSASGGDFGTASQVVIYPDQKLAIAVLCNMDSMVMGGQAAVNTDDLTNGVADAFLEDVLEPRPAPAAGPAPGAGAPPPSVNLSAEQLASKTGIYRVGSDENYIVSIAVRDRKLTFWDFWGDNYAMPMTPIDQNRFLGLGVTLVFSPADAGRPQAWHAVDAGGQQLVELPLVKFDVSKGDLESFKGEYRSDELDLTSIVAVRGSDLVVGSTTLSPVSKDAFVGEFVGVIRFVRDPRGGVTGYTMSRKSARGIRFERVKR